MEWQKVMTMISRYHSHDTRTVTIRGKEVSKPLLVLDYYQSRRGVDSKHQLLHSYLTERKRTNKWHMKLIRRLLNTSNPYVMSIYRNNIGKRTDQLSFSWGTLCCRTQSAGWTFIRQNSTLSDRITFYMRDWEETRTPETVCFVSEAREEKGRCVLMWRGTLLGMLSRPLSKVTQLYYNFYKP
jgi:hypothetical protein